MSYKRQRRAAERVQGLLLMMPWLVERKRARIDEMASTFGIDRDDLVDDLMLATCCGTPPYTPLELIEIFVDDDEVWVELPRFFTRPLRLTVAEAFALCAVAETARQLPGAGHATALASAVDKLAQVTQFDEAIVVERPDDPKLRELIELCERLEHATIDYFSPISGKESSREVVPQRVWVGDDHWYLDAFDLSVNEHRVFRVDRITSLQATGRFAASDTVPPLPDEPGFHWGSNVEHVTLHLQPAAMWVAEKYPLVSKKRLASGVWEVVLPVASTQWLGRLLVRAGDAASVVSPAGYAGVGSDTAAKILSRYS
jgi:proteasome accessory factor C